MQTAPDTVSRVSRPGPSPTLAELPVPDRGRGQREGRRSWSALGWLTSVVLVFTAVAPSVAAPNFDPPDPNTISFSDETVSLDSVGIRIGVPLGGSSAVRQITGRPTATIEMPGDLGTVMVQSRETSGKPLSVLDLEKAVMRRTLFRSLSDERIELTIDLAVETQAGISLGRSPAIPAAGRIVRPFYVRLKEETGRAMRGFAVIQIEPEVFVLFQMFSGDDQFEKARQAFELIVMSASLEEGAALDAARADQVQSGTEVLSALTRDELAAVIADTPDQFERIYRPVPGGAVADEEEIGYRRVRAWIGSAADVETGEASEQPSSEGFLLRIDGSVLLEDGLGGRSRADSRAVYYMSADREQESWKVEMSIREEGKKTPEVWNEVGFRQGESMSVQVTHLNEKGRSSTIRPSIQGEGYISRLEAYLMPKLLIHLEKEGAYSFYAYDQTAEVNRIRTVRAEKADDRPGLWRIRTDLPGEQHETALYNAYGRLVRSETSEGVVKRPIEFERLYQIWRAKNLPLD